MYQENLFQELIELHKRIEPEIRQRLEEFKKIAERKNSFEIFKELVFCLMTPQSKSLHASITLEKLEKKDLLLKGSAQEIAKELNLVRFKNNKGRYIEMAREFFLIQKKENILDFTDQSQNVKDLRERLVKTVKGIGYKEAGHFLRNIGRGQELAILDRHILKNLVSYGVIREIPVSLSRQKYLEIEKDMVKFSHRIFIPMDALDFLLWYKETGQILK
ncbi:MAG: hypothetical protein A2Y41_09600 [Spirochaetes bacterium GWB1_36_13]|nr:MAG: hypothetical protein A2Y41_09600 [Spirochaetes bacterium GWB1_36_13]